MRRLIDNRFTTPVSSLEPGSKGTEDRVIRSLSPPSDGESVLNAIRPNELQVKPASRSGEGFLFHGLQSLGPDLAAGSQSERFRPPSPGGFSRRGRRAHRSEFSTELSKNVEIADQYNPLPRDVQQARNLAVEPSKMIPRSTRLHGDDAFRSHPSGLWITALPGPVRRTPSAE